MKITQEQQLKGQELYSELVHRAWENPAFKKQLIENPKSVISEYFDSEISLPEDIKVVVNDQTDQNTIYLNIPAKLDLNDFELTEEQLEMMAGGIFPAIIAGIAIGAAAKRIYNKYC